MDARSEEESFRPGILQSNAAGRRVQNGELHMSETTLKRTAARRRSQLSRAQAKAAWGLSAPAIIIMFLFMILPFAPQALGILAARLLGFGALGCLYGGRVANLLVYALICRAALRRCAGHGPLFLAAALCPLSLYMAASMSYDAQLLACYYLMAALFAGQTFGKSEMLLYLAAFGWANMAKPWINLLWLILPLLHAKKNWRAPLKKWQFAAAALLLALGVNWLIEWYGGAFRYHYGTIGRMLDGVDQMPQLKFVLSNPLRFAAVLHAARLRSTAAVNTNANTFFITLVPPEIALVIF